MKPTPSDALSDEELARRGLSRETDIRLDREGRFYSGDHEVEHPGVARAFARWLVRAPGGRYALRNDLHYVYLTVEGAPLHVRAVHLQPDRVELELTGGEREPLRAETLRAGPDDVLYADVRDGTWVARLSPRASLELGQRFVSGEGDEAWLELGGRRTLVRRVADPLRPVGSRP